MTIFQGTSVALFASATILASAMLPAGAADRAIVKAPVAAAPAVVCTNLNWTHGWLDHGGWGGWGYQDGLVINDWAGNCNALLGLGPWAYAPEEARQVRTRR